MITAISSETGAKIRRTCRVLQLPRSGFYRHRKKSAQPNDSGFLRRLIDGIFREHKSCYGYRRVHRELVERGVDCTSGRVRRLMKTMGLRGLQKRRYKPATSDGGAQLKAPNLLQERPAPTGPDQVWAGDITYIPSAKGWLYLAVVIDLYSRRIVGWALHQTMKVGLVMEAFRRATMTRMPDRGLIFHSDQGTQYGCLAYRKQLEKVGAIQSMSARGTPYDNAWTESFIGTLKREMLRGGSFLNENDATIELFDYIEIYYNLKRKHSSLGYLSPAQFEEKANP